MKLYFCALLLTFYFAPQDPFDTVDVILTPDSQAIILPRAQVEQEFKQLCADGTNDLRLKALAAALNPMPDWPQLVMNQEPSVCNRAPKPIIPIPIEKQGGR